MSDIRNGYAVCPNTWCLDERITSELRTLLIISTLSAKHGYCFASNDYLAELLNKSKDTISGQITKLKKLGYIEVEEDKLGAVVMNRKIRVVAFEKMNEIAIGEKHRPPTEKIPSANGKNSEDKNISIKITRKEKINKKESQSANENSLSLEAEEFHQKALSANEASYPSRENMEQNQDFAMRPSEKPKRVRFTKPTIQQLTEYNAAVDLEVDCEVFYDYYESNGWRVGKSPMKDWKAAMRNWHRKQKSFRGNQNSIDLDEIYEKR